MRITDFPLEFPGSTLSIVNKHSTELNWTQLNQISSTNKTVHHYHRDLIETLIREKQKIIAKWKNWWDKKILNIIYVTLTIVFMAPWNESHHESLEPNMLCSCLARNKKWKNKKKIAKTSKDRYLRL